MDIKNSQDTQQRKLFFKVVFILALLFLLMIPNLFIRSLIHERQLLESQTQNEIASNWGPSQVVVGPVLSIPYTVTEVRNETSFVRHHTLRVLPETTEIGVNVQTQERKKSIYKTILYNADHLMEGRVVLPKESDFGEEGDIVVDWEKATIDIGLTSAACLEELVKISINGKTYMMRSGTSDPLLFHSAIHAQIDLTEVEKEFTFTVTFGMNGSKSLKYLPLANNTNIKMNSTWADPGFTGLPLPQERTVSENGFSAEWKTTEYNRSFKSMWKDAEVKLENKHKNFGVELVQTVGHYQKNMRSAKYALLILSLSFLIFFFFEILKRSKVHPMQYIFVGLSLSTFYVLLLSFSEHVGFGLAYLIASSAVVGLISWYARYILKSGGQLGLLGAILTGLYVYIYILLQMEEFALLVGSVGLFVALATVMFLSRKMDWYNLSKGD